jgi:beta-glucanase (GH16 family)
MGTRYTPAALALATAIGPVACSQPPGDGVPPDPWTSGGDDGGVPSGWTLSWSDEFNGPDGSGPDPTKWGNDVGGNGWGNQELEYYTPGSENAQIAGGVLTITARQLASGETSLPCSYGTCQYTSARINTLGKFSQKYGRFEARIEIPSGQGLWPAFWLLGDDVDQVGWPASGEVDIMENAGASPSKNHGSLHAPGNQAMTAVFSSETSLAAGFHTYAIDWTAEAIWFYVDDQLYETRNAADAPSPADWPFDQPFFILLDVAVGGTFAGAPNSATTFPQTMKVDWVRVYQETPQ